jgi:riboflavin biosynthesis pyrimidine reductase
VVPVGPADDGRGVDLGKALRSLVDRGITAVLAEPGPRLSAALVAGRAVDRLVLHIAGGVVGPAGVPRPAPCSVPPAGADWGWRTVASGVVGEDVEVVAVPAPATAGVPVQRSV